MSREHPVIYIPTAVSQLLGGGQTQAPGIGLEIENERAGPWSQAWDGLLLSPPHKPSVLCLSFFPSREGLNPFLIQQSKAFYNVFKYTLDPCTHLRSSCFPSRILSRKLTPFLLPVFPGRGHGSAGASQREACSPRCTYQPERGRPIGWEGCVLWGFVFCRLYFIYLFIYLGTLPCTSNSQP